MPVFGIFLVAVLRDMWLVKLKEHDRAHSAGSARFSAHKHWAAQMYVCTQTVREQWLTYWIRNEMSVENTTQYQHYKIDHAKLGHEALTQLQAHCSCSRACHAQSTVT